MTFVTTGTWWVEFQQVYERYGRSISSLAQARANLENAEAVCVARHAEVLNYLDVIKANVADFHQRSGLGGHTAPADGPRAIRLGDDIVEVPRDPAVVE